MQTQPLDREARPEFYHAKIISINLREANRTYQQPELKNSWDIAARVVLEMWRTRGQKG